MAAVPLLSVGGLGVNLGDRWLFRHVDVTVSAGDRLCLVGRNGAGKSTLMKTMAGLIEADEGTHWIAPATSISYLPQAPKMPRGMTIASVVMNGTGSDGVFIAAPHKAEAMLTRFDMNPATMTDGLSGGEARRVALARALVKEPDVLLMDEPTNHLDLPTITWMEDMLLARGGAMIVISHDRAFLRRVGNATLWIDGGVLRRRQGGFDGFDDWAEGIQQEEATRLYKMDRRIAAETRWSHEGITARRKRNMGRMRELENLRTERARLAAPLRKAARMETSAADGGGQMVLEAIDLSVSVPSRPATTPATNTPNTTPATDTPPINTPQGRRILFSHFNGLIRKGDRIGIIGPNGIGKSTLVKALMGHITPDSGRVREGFGLLSAYFDQQREMLDDADTPWGVLCPGGGDTVEVAGRTTHVRKYLEDFLFERNKATQRVRSLSGGEQNRLLLAKIFASEHNLLVLDEPTNDLDMETLELLQEVVADYPGTMIIISHDRDFVDRTVTALLVFEDDGRIIPHSGGYSDYLARRSRAEARKGAGTGASKKAGKGARRGGSKPQKRGTREATRGTREAKPRSTREAKRGTREAKRGTREATRGTREAKLSFRDKHALETLPSEIAALEAAIAKAEAALADTSLFQNDPTRFARLAETLAHDRASLAAKEEQWLMLELRREEIEGS